MRRWIIRLVILAAIVAVAIGARAWFLKPEPIEVTVAPVERGTIEETITNTRAGTVKAHRRTRLSPESGGMALTIPFDEGQMVRQGDVLLRLDDSLQRAQLELAQRELEAGRARQKQSCVQAEHAQRELAATSASTTRRSRPRIFSTKGAPRRGRAGRVRGVGLRRRARRLGRPAGAGRSRPDGAQGAPAWSPRSRSRSASGLAVAARSPHPARHRPHRSDLDLRQRPDGRGRRRATQPGCGAA